MRKLSAVLSLLALIAGCAHRAPAPAALPEGVSVVKQPSPGPARPIRLELRDPPVVGTTKVGQAIRFGGLSGLRFLSRSKDGKLHFLSHTDRGPNADERETERGVDRPFLVREFQPMIVFLEADLVAGSIRVARTIPLRRPDDRPLSGLPPSGPGLERPVDVHGNALPNDPYGMDLEGIVAVPDGSYWLADEYGPSLARFGADGRLLHLLRPGKGLPKILEQRRLNRGFEGLAMDGDRLYAVLQSPLDNPRSEGEENSKRSRVVRIVEVDVREKRTLAQYALVLDADRDGKLGDLTLEAPGRLVAIERGKEAGKEYRRVYRLKLAGATDLQLLPEKVAGPGGSLERMGPVELLAAGIVPVAKHELIDLTANGVTEDKIEGVDFVGRDYLAIVTDNDFGLEGKLKKKKGVAKLKDEPSALYLFPLPLLQMLD